MSLQKDGQTLHIGNYCDDTVGLLWLCELSKSVHFI